MFKNEKPFDDMTVGPLVKDVEKIVEKGKNDNANILHTSESCHKHLADVSAKKYALIKLLPPHIAEAHINAYIHIHDLEYLYARPLNCMQHDLRVFIKNGLKVDGTGGHTSSSNPAKNVETLVNHAGQVLGAAQTQMSGGQGIPLLNVFLAPFVDGLSYERIKQAMQMFIFNLNMSYVSRGSQAVFSSVNLEFDIPDFLMDAPAYGPGGEIFGVYGEYQEEAQTVLKAFNEVMLEGDALGKPHLFPNSVYRLTDRAFDYPDLMEQVHDLSAKFSIPYFAADINGERYFNVMGCRTRLNSNWTGDPELDCLRTGNLAYVSLNLPRYALKKDFWEELDQALEVSTEALLLRRQIAEKSLWKNGLMPFLTQTGKDSLEPYYRIENATMSFGVVGLSDALRILTGDDITNKASRKQGHQIMQYINDYAKNLTEETGFRWTVLQTPAESTAHRFATADRRRFDGKAPVHGERSGYYYTNSTHVDVDAPLHLIERIKAEHNFHLETYGGHISHLWFGEAFMNPAALESLTEKIYRNSNSGFWTYTSAFSVCQDEGRLLKGIHSACECGSETEIYDRVTGYLQKVSGFNNGKKSEFNDRIRYEGK